MVPVGVGKKHIGFQGHFSQQLKAEFSKSGTAVENEAMPPYQHFDTGGITTIFDGSCPWAGNTTSYSPKPD